MSAKDTLLIRTVLASVTDKTGLVDFIAALKRHNPQLKVIASGGTAATLEKAKIHTIDVADYTEFPECFGGRVKTLHPKIAGGILYRHGIDDAEAEKLGVESIDLVVCNLYAFESAAQNPDLAVEDLVEQVDIGGPTLLRAAAKNYASTAITVDPKDYTAITEEIERDGGVSLTTRERLAVSAFNATADYEACIAQTLTRRLAGEETRRLTLRGGKRLRYGENPDQEGWVYQFPTRAGIAHARVLGGKELSYNNFEDATIAYKASGALTRLGAEHGVAIIKHGCPCGYATGANLVDAFARAWEGDPKSSFGSVISCTSSVSLELKEQLTKRFVEVIIAPHFSEEFVAWAHKAKPKLRLLEVPSEPSDTVSYKNISGGMLLQTEKHQFFAMPWPSLIQGSHDNDGKQIGAVTKRKPSSGQEGLFAFGVAAVHAAKSNASAVVREYAPGYYQLLGMGSGQPNRVDTLQKLAIPRALQVLNDSEGSDVGLDECLLATDGFFPFDDSIRYAASQGIRYCLQPGGGVRDDEVVAAADECDVCMVMTGARYFSH